MGSIWINILGLTLIGMCVALIFLIIMIVSMAITQLDDFINYMEDAFINMFILIENGVVNFFDVIYSDIVDLIDEIF